MPSVALENTWSFWTSNMRGDPDVKFVDQFNSIQQFWEQFKGRPVNEISDKTYLHVFKDDIKPLWEDPKNLNGGHFKLTAKSATQSEKMWLSVLLNMLGEQFPISEIVNGASVMSNQVGNNLVKVWLSSTEKAKVQATREFLLSVLDADAFLPNVTFVPHKLVVKGAGKKISDRITSSPSKQLAAPLVCPPSPQSRSPSPPAVPTNSRPVSPVPHRPHPHHSGRPSRAMYAELVLSAPVAGGPIWTCYPDAPCSPYDMASLGFSGALSSLPSSWCSDRSSTPPSPHAVSPTVSFVYSEYEVDTTPSAHAAGHLMPPSPAITPVHRNTATRQRRSWSTASQDSSYVHNPYSLDNSVIYTDAC